MKFLIPFFMLVSMSTFALELTDADKASIAEQLKPMMEQQGIFYSQLEINTFCEDSMPINYMFEWCSANITEQHVMNFALVRSEEGLRVYQEDLRVTRIPTASESR